MGDDKINIRKIYSLFGVLEMADNLETQGKTDELSKLEQSVSKFLLGMAILDLSVEAQNKLMEVHISSGEELYIFLNENITNFPEKLKTYGNEFKRTIVENLHHVA